MIFVCIALTGCATNRAQEARNTLTEQRQYEPATASALAFDAPVAAAYPLPGLERDAREPGAFIGYQETVIESFSIGMEDNQSSDPSLDLYYRSSLTGKFGTRYR